MVDCGSTDATIDILTNFRHGRLRVVQVPFCGVAKARNIGIDHAHGEIIVILDSDDIAFPNRLRTQVEALKSLDGAVGVGASIVVFDEERATSKTYSYPADSQQISILLNAGLNPLPHSTLTYFRSAFVAVGGYSEAMEKAEDFHFLHCLLNQGNLYSIPITLAQITVHRDSHTFSHKPMGRDVYFYCLLSLLMNDTESAHGLLPQSEVECWLDHIGQGRRQLLLSKIALKSIRRNYRDLSMSSWILLSKLMISYLWIYIKLLGMTCLGPMAVKDNLPRK